ncbi:MAG: aspartate--ammonia ligase [Eubacteriales bacterium]
MNKMLGKPWIPEGYQPKLGLYETQKAIGLIKNVFQVKLCAALHLKRVTAPLFVDPDTGLNDNLNGTERPVSFDIPAVQGDGEVVHSLAKWKRLALQRYDFHVGNGLITDMNAIRRDEELDNIHSIYVDQWDWEKVIDRSMRTEAFLEETVTRIVSAICGTLDEMKWQFSDLDTELTREVTFVSTQELEDLYPDLTPKQRETAFVREHKTVFIKQIGKALNSGEIHDGRAPDYDDWSLNGDIMFWNDTLDMALEISSMGIRVDAASLKSQLEIRDCMDRAELPFHKMLLADELPLTIGGGIGQSRLCMLLLGKAHIGEVQSSLWDEETRKACESKGILLL